jgi:ArsR family transcriptional regulator
MLSFLGGYKMSFELIFKALGESTRIRIVRLLSYKPMYVCELEAVLDMSQPRISQHLKILKNANIVSDEKEGQRSVYNLNKEFLQQIFSNFMGFLECPLEEIEDFSEEVERICHLSNNPDIVACKNGAACKNLSGRR